MTRDEIDILWQQAMEQAFKDDEMFTPRYHFAALVAAAEHEACCEIVDHELDSNGHAEAIKIAIRARSKA